MSSTTLSTSPPLSYLPITDPIIITSPIPTSPPLTIPLPLDNSSFFNTLGSSSTAPSNESPITPTSVPHFLRPPELKGQNFRSFEEIFDFIDQQPKENRQTLLENLLHHRNLYVRQLERWDE